MAECSWPFSVTSPAPMRGATRSPWPLRCLCTWPAKILRITPSPRRCAFTWISLIRPTRPSPRTPRSIWNRGHLWQFIPGDKRIVYLGPFKILPERLCIATLFWPLSGNSPVWEIPEIASFFLSSSAWIFAKCIRVVFINHWIALETSY